MRIITSNLPILNSAKHNLDIKQRIKDKPILIIRDHYNPKPYILNPEPYILNPKPYILHPKPSTLHPKS